MVPNGRVVWANAQKNGFMKILRKLLLTIIAVGMASTAVARNYDELVAEGYRWTTTDARMLALQKTIYGTSLKTGQMRKSSIWLETYGRTT